jgi:hypothetical protein
VFHYETCSWRLAAVSTKPVDFEVLRTIQNRYEGAGFSTGGAAKMYQKVSLLRRGDNIIKIKCLWRSEMKQPVLGESFNTQNVPSVP